MKSQHESDKDSLRVMHAITPFLENFIGKGNVTDRLVRKLAHIFEYSIFGVVISILALISKQPKFKLIVICLASSFAVALIDESIQIYSKRGSQFSDVLLDFASASIAILFVFLIYYLIIVLRNHRYFKSR